MIHPRVNLKPLLGCSLLMASVARAQFARPFWQLNTGAPFPTFPVAFTYDSRNEYVLILENMAACTMRRQSDCGYYYVRRSSLIFHL